MSDSINWFFLNWAVAVRKIDTDIFNFLCVEYNSDVFLNFSRIAYPEDSFEHIVGLQGRTPKLLVFNSEIFKGDKKEEIEFLGNLLVAEFNRASNIPKLNSFCSDEGEDVF